MKYKFLPAFLIITIVSSAGQSTFANSLCEQIFSPSLNYSSSDLERVIAAPDSNEFSGPSRQYGKIMTEALLNVDPQVNGFNQALKFLVAKRIEVLKLDLAKASSPEDKGYFETQLHYMSDAPDSLMNLRMNGGGDFPNERIQTPVWPRKGRYTEFYKLIKESGVFKNEGIYQEWSPPNSPNGPRLAAPALKIIDSGIYMVSHAQNRDVTAIVDHLNSLWNQVLLSQDQSVSRKLIAEFEWWFIVGNPTARGAASLGDILSLSLQLHKGLPIRQEFQHLDWYVLTRNLEDYVNWRMNP
jgi:hypothetical protein